MAAAEAAAEIAVATLQRLSADAITIGTASILAGAIVVDAILAVVISAIVVIVAIMLQYCLHMLTEQLRDLFCGHCCRR